ncbi:MAG: metallophosphoesterase [Myxococcota bacterium]
MKLRVWAIVPLLFACQQDKQPEVIEGVKPAGTEAKAEVEPPAPPKKSFPECVGPIGDGEKKEVTIGNQKWELNGSTLSATSGLKKNRLVVGALTDIKEDSEENLANLDAFVATFKKEKVDLVMIAGDSGLDKAQLLGVLSKVAEVGVPVFNIAGNREGKADYDAAMKEITEKHPNVLNLNAIRRVDTPLADFISMPGYFNPSYIHAEDGCQYFQADVDALDDLAKASDSPVVLVSHGGPLQTGEQAIDRTAEGANVGDPMLTKAVEKNEIKFGIFGNIHEAGGRGVDLAGENLLPEGKPHESLFLNPGPGDAVAWQMNDGSESLGMASVLTFDNKGRATYVVHRIPDPEKGLSKR